MMDKSTLLSTVREIAAPMRDEDRLALVLGAAADLPARSLRGQPDRRWFSDDLGLGRGLTRQLKKAGLGEGILSSKGANSLRWFFPLEILERIVEGRA